MAALKFTFRNEDQKIDLSKFDIFIKIPIIGAITQPAPNPPIPDWIKVRRYGVSVPYEITTPNPLQLNSTFKVKIKIKSKVPVDGDSDESNIVIIRGIEFGLLLDPNDQPVNPLQLDPDANYTVNITAIDLGGASPSLANLANKDIDATLTPKTGTTIVIGAGMP